MDADKAHQVRGEDTHQRILDAAERLLREGNASFSMRELAAAAGVSFATPFNRFGSKAGIMHALSARRIATMRERLAEASLPRTPADRVLLAVDIAVNVMLAEPVVNRVVMGSIGMASDRGGDALARSTMLWAEALGGGEQALSERLAFAFRGVLSFWTAGELADDELHTKAQELARSLVRAAS